MNREYQLTLHPNHQIHVEYARCSASELFNPSDFNALSKNLEVDFRCYMDQLSQQLGPDPCWWALPFASRNTLSNQFFLDLAYIAYAKGFAGQDVKRIIVHSHELKSALRRVFPLAEIIVPKMGRSFRDSLFFGLLMWVRLWLLIWFRFLAAKANPRSKVDRTASTRGKCLVEIFIGEDLVRNGKFFDRYYNSIFSTEESFAYLVSHSSPNHPVQSIKTLRKAGARLVLKEDYLHITDYVWLFSRFVSVVTNAFKLAPPPFLDQDVAGVLRSRYWQNAMSYGVLEALLMFRFIRRLSLEAMQPRIILDWFEGQGLDRLTALACFQGQIPISGYLGFTPRENLLNTVPTPEDITQHVVPRKLYVMSPQCRDVIRSHEATSSIDIQLAPAFRYKIPQIAQKAESSCHILVGLPIGLPEINSIIFLIKSMNTERLKRFVFKIRIHPASDKKRVLANISELRGLTWQLDEQDVTRSIEECKCVISTGSTIPLEAISLGRKAILIGSLTALSQNPTMIGVPDHLYRFVYQPKELENALNVWLGQDIFVEPELRAYLFAANSDQSRSAFLESLVRH